MGGGGVRVANATELKALVLLSEIERALVAGVHKLQVGALLSGYLVTGGRQT